MTYFEILASRLASALDAAPLPYREQHVAFLTAGQNSDGGFSGREGDSDLYYTAFALRALDISRALDVPLSRRSAEFLRSQLNHSASIVDLVSLLYGARLVEARHGIDVFADTPDDWAMATAGALEAFRRPDGGYGKTAGRKVESPGGRVQSDERVESRESRVQSDNEDGPTSNSGLSASSTYHTFLVALCQQMIGGTMPEPEACVRLLLSRRRDDGGFVEIAPMRRSGTNPTAAAVALLNMLGACDEETAAGVVDFLAGLQTSEGGLPANTRAPLADLLSTFTGLLTLTDLGAAGRLDLPAMRAYAESLACPTGGFRGGLWDSETDAEYTFYGLATIALLYEVSR